MPFIRHFSFVMSLLSLSLSLCFLLKIEYILKNPAQVALTGPLHSVSQSELVSLSPVPLGSLSDLHEGLESVIEFLPVCTHLRETVDS